MKAIFETMANTDFFLFMLGIAGIDFFEKFHMLLCRCNAKAFSFACVILIYVALHIHLHK